MIQRIFRRSLHPFYSSKITYTTLQRYLHVVWMKNLVVPIRLISFCTQNGIQYPYSYSLYRILLKMVENQSISFRFWQAARRVVVIYGWHFHVEYSEMDATKCTLCERTRVGKEEEENQTFPYVNRKFIRLQCKIIITTHIFKEPML